MRSALDGRADKVRASVTVYCCLRHLEGAGRVFARRRDVRDCVHAIIRDCMEQTLGQAVAAACADGAGHGQQWPGVALLRRASSAFFLKKLCTALCVSSGLFSCLSPPCQIMGNCLRISTSASKSCRDAGNTAKVSDVSEAAQAVGGIVIKDERFDFETCKEINLSVSSVRLLSLHDVA
jgi:hypothetical protein